MQNTYRKDLSVYIFFRDSSVTLLGKVPSVVRGAAAGPSAKKVGSKSRKTSHLPLSEP